MRIKKMEIQHELRAGRNNDQVTFGVVLVILVIAGILILVSVLGCAKESADEGVPRRETQATSATGSITWTRENVHAALKGMKEQGCKLSGTIELPPDEDGRWPIFHLDEL